MNKDRIRKIEARLDTLYDVPIHKYDMFKYKNDAKLGAWFCLPHYDNEGYNKYLASLGYDILFIPTDGSLHSWFYFFGRKCTPAINRKEGDMIAIRLNIIEPSSEITNTSLDDYDIFEV